MWITIHKIQQKYYVFRSHDKHIFILYHMLIILRCNMLSLQHCEDYAHVTGLLNFFNSWEMKISLFARFFFIRDPLVNATKQDYRVKTNDFEKNAIYFTKQVSILNFYFYITFWIYLDTLKIWIWNTYYKYLKKLNVLRQIN